jgi:hypothetical protein
MCDPAMAAMLIGTVVTTSVGGIQQAKAQKASSKAQREMQLKSAQQAIASKKRATSAMKLMKQAIPKAPPPPKPSVESIKPPKSKSYSSYRKRGKQALKITGANIPY